MSTQIAWKFEHVVMTGKRVLSNGPGEHKIKNLYINVIIFIGYIQVRRHRLLLNSVNLSMLQFLMFNHSGISKPKICNQDFSSKSLSKYDFKTYELFFLKKSFGRFLSFVSMKNYHNQTFEKDIWKYLLLCLAKIILLRAFLY